MKKRGGGRPYYSLGFTLAEVLITLGIIGIVAAMTMPALIAKYQKQQTISQLKKAYSEINQAIRLSESKFGTLDSWDFADFESSEERVKYFGENYLLPNLKVAKNCVSVHSGCWAEDTFNIDGNSWDLGEGIGRRAFITSSGYSVYYWVHAVGNGGWFYIDVNGPKKPNTLGKDIFPFIMSWGDAGRSDILECPKKLGFLPKGLDCRELPTRVDLINGSSNLDYSQNFSCKKGSGKRGAGGYCAAVIMIDGWQMIDDYPW